MHYSSGRALRLAIVLGGAALAGCAHRAEVRLEQPHAPKSQRDLQLTTEWSACALSGGTRECVLEFPSPGAIDGVRDFRVYLALPAGEGVHELAAQGAGARGFLIQEVGRLRGKAIFTLGQVRVSSVTLQRGLWRLDLNLETNDGARLSGRAYVRERPDALRQFQRRFAGDIAALRRSPAPAAPPGVALAADEQADDVPDAADEDESAPRARGGIAPTGDETPIPDDEQR